MSNKLSKIEQLNLIKDKCPDFSNIIFNACPYIRLGKGYPYYGKGCDGECDKCWMVCLGKDKDNL